MTDSPEFRYPVDGALAWSDLRQGIHFKVMEMQGHIGGDGYVVEDPPKELHRGWIISEPFTARERRLPTDYEPGTPLAHYLFDDGTYGLISVFSWGFSPERVENDEEIHGIVYCVAV